VTLTTCIRGSLSSQG